MEFDTRLVLIFQDDKSRLETGSLLGLGLGLGLGFPVSPVRMMGSVGYVCIRAPRVRTLRWDTIRVRVRVRVRVKGIRVRIGPRDGPHITTVKL